jgi:hypothetical protein
MLLEKEMNIRFVSSFAISLMALAGTAQAQNNIPRTPDGHPDFQGFWANNIATPLQRPPELANHPLLTDAEVAAMRKKAQETYLSGKVAAAFGDGIFLAIWDSLYGSKTGKRFESFEPSTGDYSSEWNDQRVWDNRTSLITDPPDGRLPPVTARAKEMREAAAKALRRPAWGPEDRTLGERCLSSGSPRIGAGYQSYFQFIETPTAFVAMTEMFHDARVLRLDGVPHPAAGVHQWLGDSIAHWEGDTLVVDSTNYKERAFQGVSSEKLHITERYTLHDAETVRWELTVDDPDTWTKPWSVMIPLQRSHEPVYEYACHEGNVGLKGILAGARADDAKMAAEK